MYLVDTGFHTLFEKILCWFCVDKMHLYISIALWLRQHFSSRILSFAFCCVRCTKHATFCWIGGRPSFAIFASSHSSADYQIGVPTTSWILLANSRKLSFSTLIVKPVLIFDKTNPFPAQALPSLPAQQHWAGRPGQAWAVGRRKTVQQMYWPAQSNKKTSKMGTPIIKSA